MAKKLTLEIAVPDSVNERNAWSYANSLVAILPPSKLDQTTTTPVRPVILRDDAANEEFEFD